MWKTGQFQQIVQARLSKSGLDSYSNLIEHACLYYHLKNQIIEENSCFMIQIYEVFTS